MQNLYWRMRRTNESPNLAQTIRPCYNQQKKKKKKKRKRKKNEKKRTCLIVDFVVPVDHRVKLKENEKKDKYLDLARELKKLWNIKVTVIPLVVGALVTVTKSLVKEPENLKIRSRVKTIQIKTLLRSVRIPRRVLKI